MDDLFETIISTIIGVILTAAIGGVPMYIYYNRRVEHLTTEKANLTHELNDAQKKMSHLSEEKELAKIKFQNLNELYKNLEFKWNMVQNHNPVTILYNWQDSTWHEEKVKTKDTIKFNFVSLFSMNVDLYRTSSDGPVVSLPDCNHPRMLEGMHSTESQENSFLIQKSRTLRLFVSRSLCSDSDKPESMKNVEEVNIHCVDYDCEKQVATLKFRISPQSGGDNE